MENNRDELFKRLNTFLCEYALDKFGASAFGYSPNIVRADQGKALPEQSRAINNPAEGGDHHEAASQPHL